MEPRFRSVDRDQLFLLPPDVRDWLPVGHPALFLVELVERLDISEFVAGYRSSPDRGRPAYHPRVMVGVVLYASMTAVSSSRRIERLLATDAGFRVVAANERPDHVTISRFLVRHGKALQSVFAQVVALAGEAGLIDATLVAVDGTKMAADASKSRNEKLGDLRARFTGWAQQVQDNDRDEDAAEQARSDGGPVEAMEDHDAMCEWIERRLRERSAEPEDRKMNTTDPDSGLLPRSGGGWVQGYNAQAAAVTGGIVVAADITASPVDSSVLTTMVEHIGTAITDATGERAGVVVADAGYWDSATIDDIEADEDLADLLVATGRRQATEAPDPLDEPDLAGFEAEMADYQRAVEQERDRRIEVIARVVDGDLLIREGADLLGLSVPRVGEMKLRWEQSRDPEQLGTPRPPGRTKPKRPPTPTRARRARHAMDTRLVSPAGRSFYRQRQAIIEPVFGDLKTNRRTTRFLRRGTDKVQADWKLMLTGHNLTILHTRG